MQSTGVAARIRAREPRRLSATRIVLSTFGVVVGLAGVEHGVGEILQGAVRPQAVAIESWPDSRALEILGGEPAMTIIPNLLVTGLLAVTVGLAIAIWSAWFVDRRQGGIVLVLLSVLLLLVGGGMAPPLIGVVLGLGAKGTGGAGARPSSRLSHALGLIWPWTLGAGLLGYLGLMPGVVLLYELWGVESSGLVVALAALSFTGLFLSLPAARSHDRRSAAPAGPRTGVRQRQG